MEGIGIGLKQNPASAGFDFIFVARTRHHAGQENFPDPGAGMAAHRVAPSVPAIEVPNDADAPRIWGPNGETRAFHAVQNPRMRAHLFVAAQVAAFGMEIKVHVPQEWAKAIGVIDDLFARPQLKLEPIRKRIAPLSDRTRKEPGIMGAGQHSHHSAGLALKDGHARGFGMEGAHHSFARLGVLVHAQDGERIVLVAGEDGGNSARKTTRLRHAAPL